MYLHDWAESEFFGMVMDFEGVFCTKAEYEAAQSPYSNHDRSRCAFRQLLAREL